MIERPERPDFRSVLERSAILTFLTPEQKDQLILVSRLVSVVRGETLWMAGDEIDYFGVVGAGFIKMVRSSSSGKEMTVDLMGPGQVFGMLGAIQGSRCPLSARAVCDAWYLRVPNGPFLPMYTASTALKDHVVQRTTNRLRDAYDTMARMSSGLVEQRLAAVLLVLVDSYGQPSDGGKIISVPLTRQDLSEMAGTTVESAIRVMSRWQKVGLVKTDHKHVVILDEDGLEKCL